MLAVCFEAPLASSQEAVFYALTGALMPAPSLLRGCTDTLMKGRHFCMYYNGILATNPITTISYKLE